MGDYSFFHLDNACISELKDDVKLDSLLLEKEMLHYNGGLVISRVTSKLIKDDSVYREFVPHFYDPFSVPAKEDIERLIKKHSAVNLPCSMLINSLEELSAHMSIAYQVSHFNYILGKNIRMRNSFPKFCCGTSSHNVILSLFEFGYSNATYIASRYDHAYVALPFVMNDTNVSGTIIIDPTYDQLLYKKLYFTSNIRNLVSIKLGSEWKYKTSWKSGANLFPDSVSSINILNMDYNKSFYSQEYTSKVSEYFEKAFSNPIMIRINYDFNHLPLPIIRNSYLSQLDEHAQLKLFL